MCWRAQWFLCCLCWLRFAAPLLCHCTSWITCWYFVIYEIYHCNEDRLNPLHIHFNNYTSNLRLIFIPLQQIDCWLCSDKFQCRNFQRENRRNVYDNINTIFVDAIDKKIPSQSLPSEWLSTKITFRWYFVMHIWFIAVYQPYSCHFF